MAAVGTPSPGLYGAVLQTLHGTDPWSQRLSSAIAGLVDHLTAEEAECLPEAFAGVLPLLRRDPERLRFAAEIAGRLDFFEAAGAICDLAIGLPDRRLLLEAAFLGGTTTSSLNYLRKRELLTPRRSDGFRWTFRDVVAVRAWTYLKAISPRRVSSRVVTSLARFGGDVDAARLGVTSEGSVLVDRGTGWVDVETGASPLDIDVSDVDDVFRPFDYGGGHVLDLLQASTNTRLNPTVLSGAPHLEGHRISAKALASVDRLGRREVIEAFYPELAGKSFEDTVTVGMRLLNVV